MEPSKRSRSRIDSDSGVFQSDHTQQRLATLGAENNLGNGFGSDEAHTGEAVLHFDWPAVRHFIDGLSLGLHARCLKAACRGHAINGTCVNQEFGTVSLSATGQALDRGCYVGDTHLAW